MDKAALRRALIEERLNLPDRLQRADLLQQVMRIWLVNRPDTVIGAYWPIKGEFDPLPALHRWKEDGELLDEPLRRRVALPVVNKQHKTLTFHAWYPGCPMEEDAYGIPKPKDTEVIVPTLLFVPCVGYAPGGYRLGYGGGFYDRTLATLQPKPFTVGLGFTHGYLDDFEPEEFDLPLDAILNDNGVVWPVLAARPAPRGPVMRAAHHSGLFSHRWRIAQPLAWQADLHFSGAPMLKLYIGNKNYSSWSMRPWVLLKQAGIAFEEVRVRFDSFDADSEFKRVMSPVSPTGKVPALVDGDLVVWDTLASAEYAAERHPDKKLWPADAKARARARSVCAEMHSGFTALRGNCPMNIEANLADAGALIWRDKAGVRTDVQRLVEMWSALLQEHGGPMLFGEFTVADAYFAPVCMRLHSYALPVPTPIKAYVDRVRALPGVKAWIDEALAEKDFLDFEEPYRLRHTEG